jgi:hypothetical protein
MENGPMGPEQAEAALMEWWAQQPEAAQAD